MENAPGRNVRELENLIERLVVIIQENVVPAEEIVKLLERKKPVGESSAAR